MEKRKFHSGESINSLAAFPKDTSNSFLFSTFMSTNSISRTFSQRSSTFNKTSNTSLYENYSENTDESIISFSKPRYSKIYHRKFSTVKTVPSKLETVSSSIM